jgi:pimeloyl-ACP methyl ester carboxylesterase
MPFAKINGVSIHYDTFGSGQGIILIPGWGGSGESWRPEMIKLLSEQCTVVTYDPRGTGQSEKPDIPYSMKMFAEDAAQLIKALKLAPINVMGFSMGGSVAQVLALEPRGGQECYSLLRFSLWGATYPHEFGERHQIRYNK